MGHLLGTMGHLLGTMGHLPGTMGHLPGTMGHLPGTMGHHPGTMGHIPGTIGHLLGAMGHLPNIMGHLLGTMGYLPVTLVTPPRHNVNQYMQFLVFIVYISIKLNTKTEEKQCIKIHYNMMLVCKLYVAEVCHWPLYDTVFLVGNPHGTIE
jgi:hypothetical protein